MRSNHPAWLNWEGGVEQQEFDIGAAVSGELFRNPDNPFEAWDEDGQPCLPMTIGDESASSELHSDPLDNQPWPSWGTQQSGVAIFDQGARHPAPASTSMLDSFDWSVPDHPQTRVRIGDEIVSIDAEMGPLIFLMNRAGINTVTSCQGDERQWAYVMIADLVAALKFLRLWHRHLKPLGHPPTGAGSRAAGRRVARGRRRRISISGIRPSGRSRVQLHGDMEALLPGSGTAHARSVRCAQA